MKDETTCALHREGHGVAPPTRRCAALYIDGRLPKGVEQGAHECCQGRSNALCEIDFRSQFERFRGRLGRPVGDSDRVCLLFCVGECEARSE